MNQLVSIESQRITSYSNLVHYVIRKFYPYHPGFEYEDLVQIGTMGLLKAIRKDDPQKGSFVSFAIRVIKSAICDELRKIHRKKRSGQVLSLNATQSNLENGREWIDAIADPAAGKAFNAIEEDNPLVKITTDKEKFTDTEYELLQFLIKGCNVEVIAEKMELSQRKIRSLIRDLKSKIYMLMGRSEPVPTRRIIKTGSEESSPINTALDLSEFLVFDASNSAGNRECHTITISKIGKVNLSAAIGAKYQTGTKLEVLVNKKCNIIIIRPSNNGIACRPNGGQQTQGKQIACKSLLHHLEPLKIPLPLRFKAEFDANINGWVGRK